MKYDFTLVVPAKPLLLCVCVATAISGCASFNNKLSGNSSALTAGNSSDFQRGLYASAGIGASRLDPSVENFPGLDVNDRVEPAGQVTVGADLSPTFAVEVHSADLGSAGFSPAGAADGSAPAGRVNYHATGISALAYVGKNKHNAGRRGLNAFGRLGLAAVDNSLVGDTLSFEREDESPVLVGAGLEYSTGKGLGMRAEALTNGADLSYTQVGVLYRLGLGSKKPRLAQAKPAQEIVATAAPVAVALPVDSDADGVLNNADQCPGTAVGIVVDDSGCQIAAARIDMVHFDIDSAELTSRARGILTNVASQLVSRRSATLTLEGHADATGDDAYNLSLSKRRANNVANFLTSRGVNKSQVIDISAFGETSPAEGNDNVGGRAANRRVELYSKGIAR